MSKDTRRTDATTLTEASGIAQRLLEDSWESPNQARRICNILDQFVTFAETGFGLHHPEAVTAAAARAFVEAPSADGNAPSVPLMHRRRLSLRLLFRSLRHVGAAVGDPTLDLELPPRSQLATRPLVDEEVTLCRGHAMWSLGDLRRASAWALAEATCRSVEIGQIRVRDIDVEGQRVWIRGGRATAERWGHLTDWGVNRLALRVNGFASDPDALVVYGGSGSSETGQVSACIALSDVLTRAGLATEPDVRPASVASWAGRRILAETGRIDEVARRLGMASLDRAARFIAFDWNGGSS